jgi:hypothetical protein
MAKVLSHKFLLPVITVGIFFLYGLLLIGGVPRIIVDQFHGYSFWLFSIVLIIYFLIFRLPQKAAWIIGLGFTLLIFALSLLYLWTSGYSDNGIIGGLLPYKDGKYYYWGTQMLLNGDLITTKGVQAAGRPLFPAFMSILNLFTGENLKWALALVVGLAAFFSFLSAFYFAEQLGSVVAAVYMTLLYFYIQPMLGFHMSELAGFTFGAFGCVLMWKAAKDLNVGALIIGLVVTMYAVSIRTGAFFIFPAFVLWAGWAFRKNQKFSLKVAVISAATVAITFLVMNVIFPRIIVEPGGITNANFAYALYGQVRGGVGWNEAIKATGTRRPDVVLQAALDFFLRHPLSLFIGIAKSYRDFFFFKSSGIFPMTDSPSGIIYYVIAIVLIVLGMVKTFREISKPTSSLLLAGFIGIFLSIPFLPPIDGGRRFYASTMAFFFLFVAFPLSGVLIREKIWDVESVWVGRLVQGLSLSLIALAMIGPVLFQQFRGAPVANLPDCPSGQDAFVVTITPDSFIDLVPDQNDTCGMVPSVCLSDFETNSVDKLTDDFYQELVKQANAIRTVTRISLYNDFFNQKHHYLLGEAEQLQPVSKDGLISGCAVEIKTEHQSIYKVESIFSP